MHKKRPSLTKETLKIFWQHTKKQGLYFGLFMLGNVSLVFLEAIKPILYKRFFNTLGGGDQQVVSTLISVLWLILIINVGVWLMERLRWFAYNVFVPRVAKDLLDTCFQKIHSHSYRFFANNFAGSLTRKAARFPRAFEGIMDSLVLGIVQKILRFSVILAVISFWYWQIAVAVLVWTVVYIAGQVWMTKIKMSVNRKSAEQDSKVSGILSDTISNHSTVLSMSGLPFELNFFKGQTREMARLMKKRWDILEVGKSIQMALMVALEFGVMYGALSLWRQGKIQIGDFVLLQSYVFMLFEHLWSIGQYIQNIDRDATDANEMTEILLQTPDILDAPNAKPLKVKQGQIEFRDVQFSYEPQVRSSSSVIPDKRSLTKRDPESLHNSHNVSLDRTKKPKQSQDIDSGLPALSESLVETGMTEEKTTNSNLPDRHILTNFSLTVKPQEKLALVGPSGGGKSTITKLLFRFYDVNQGKILIDNTDITKVTQDSLRQSMSLVPQEPILFHRTLLENIRYGKPEASDAEVEQASKQAHAHEFISKFPDKYNTLVGERGVKLSGGERQRVAIARAILKNAPILILDEATSALDSESENLIQDALKHLMKDKTVIVIAHRLSTIMQMDRIVVIENGSVKEQGKHKELLKVKDGMYQKLWGIQAGGFA